MCFRGVATSTHQPVGSCTLTFQIEDRDARGECVGGKDIFSPNGTFSRARKLDQQHVIGRRDDGPWRFPGDGISLRRGVVPRQACIKTPIVGSEHDCQEEIKHLQRMIRWWQCGLEEVDQQLKNTCGEGDQEATSRYNNAGNQNE